MTELDFSYNRVADQENLLFCQKLKSLQVLIITGNLIGINNDYKELEQTLYQTVSAVVVNHPTSPPSYLSKNRKQRKDLLKKLPYPKPIASIMSDNTKDVVSKHLYEAELSKGIAVPLGEIEPSKEGEDEIFPEANKQNRQHTDIFTPPEAAQREKEKKFFVTENPDLQKYEEGAGNEEINEEGNMEPGAEEREGEDENDYEMMQKPEEIEEDDKDYGVHRMRDFTLECKEYLGDVKMYNAMMPISLACKALKHALRFPTTFVGSNDSSHYMKATLASMISKNLKHKSNAINFKELQRISPNILYLVAKISQTRMNRQKEQLILPSVAPYKKSAGESDSLKAITTTKELVAGGKIPVDRLEETMDKILNISLDKKGIKSDSNERVLAINDRSDDES